jgi:hypothetical protein
MKGSKESTTTNRLKNFENASAISGGLFIRIPLISICIKPAFVFLNFGKNSKLG